MNSENFTNHTKSTNALNITISVKSIIVFLSAIVLLLFFYKAQEAIMLLFASFVIASALYPTVDWMNKRMKRELAVGLLYFIGSLVFIILSVPFFAILIDQSNEFIKDFPQYWSHIQVFINKIHKFIENRGYSVDYSQALSSLSGFADFGKDIVNQSINLTVNLFIGTAMAFTLAFIVLYLLLDKKELKESYLRLFPIQYREKAAFISITISRKVGGYVRGQLLLMAIVGILTTIALAIAGIEFALLLGIIAGTLEIIPIVGPVMAMIPAVIVALAKNPWLAVYVIVIYFTIQRVQNSFISPWVLGKFLELHPVIIVSAFLLAASTGGILFVILSPAIAAAVYVLVQELYLNKINLNEVEHQGSE